MHERMEFPWAVEETPRPVVSVDVVNSLVDALDEAYAELLADSMRDGPRCLLLTTIEAALEKAGHKVTS